MAHLVEDPIRDLLADDTIVDLEKLLFNKIEDRQVYSLNVSNMPTVADKIISSSSGMLYIFGYSVAWFMKLKFIKFPDWDITSFTARVRTFISTLSKEDRAKVQDGISIGYSHPLLTVIRI